MCQMRGETLERRYSAKQGGEGETTECWEALNRPGEHLCSWRKREKEGRGGCSRTTMLPADGVPQSEGRDSGDGELSDALGPGQKRGKAAGWHSSQGSARSLETVSEGEENWSFLDIY